MMIQQGNTCVMTLVETRLTQAKIRRQKADTNREFVVQVRNERARQRAQQNLALKQEKLRTVNTKVAEVQQRRAVIERERQQNVAALMESHLSKKRAEQQKNDCHNIEARLTQAKERRQKADEDLISMVTERRQKADEILFNMMEEQQKKHDSTIEAKLTLAKERRQKADENLISMVTERLQKADENLNHIMAEQKKKNDSTIEARLSQAKERRQKADENLLSMLIEKQQKADENLNHIIAEQQKKLDSTIEARLIQAKERRQKADEDLISMVTERRQKADEILIHMMEEQRKKNDSTIEAKLIQAKERRQKRRRRVMETTATRFHLALSRAERLNQKRRNRADSDKRRKRVRCKRISLESERKECLSSDMDLRSDRAKRNLESRLRDRQCKAHGDVVRANSVARRVKAARLLQSVVRKKLNFPDVESKDGSSGLSHTVAAIRLQNFWRMRVVMKRLSLDKTSSSSKNSLASILNGMGFSSKESDTASNEQPFERLAAEINKISTLKSAQSFLSAFDPLLKYVFFGKKKAIVTDRVFLSAFLIAVHPDEVLEGKQNTDVCSKLLEQASKKLIRSLQNYIYGSNAAKDKFTGSVEDLTSVLISYGTLFNLWKNSDWNELVSKMLVSAEQSWIAFLTSKEALLYGNQRIGSSSSKETLEGALYQSRLRHEMSKKGASKVVRRIRKSLDRLLGKDEGMEAMKRAKEGAMRKIEIGNLMSPLKAEVDDACRVSLELKAEVDDAFRVSFETSDQENGYPKLNKEDMESSSGKAVHSPSSDRDQHAKLKKDQIPEHLMSNAHVVHKILLTDPDNVEDLFILSPNGYPTDVFDTAESFMNWWRSKDSRGATSGITNLSSLEEITAITMERAYFDTLEKEMVTKKSTKGIHDVVLKLLQRTRDLVPNRTDLHSIFRDEDLQECRELSDLMRLLLDLSVFMSDDLEAPFRSHSTVDWRRIAMTWIESKGSLEGKKSVPYEFSNPEAFLIASVVFLLKKVELCHVDKVNFELIRVAPLIRKIGNNYEIRNFLKKYGSFGHKSLKGTQEWMRRSQAALTRSPNLFRDVIKTDCFVDELLFVSEQMQTPEVLALDMDLVTRIRQCAKIAVIGSCLFLHACNISGVPAPQSSSSSSTLRFRRDNVALLLKTNPSIDLLSAELIAFVEEIRNRPLEPKKASAVKLIVGRVCDGNDAVLKLLDGRMRQFFKFSCKFDSNTKSHRTPRSMKTGLSSSDGASSSGPNGNTTAKAHFLTLAEKEAKKLGFGMFSNDLTMVSFEANKAIHHCLSLYGDAVFVPMLNRMTAMDLEG